MSEKTKEEKKKAEVEEAESTDNVETAAEAQEEETVELTPEEAIAKELDETKAQLENAKKEYLYLMAEFDNFRKRTIKGKADIIRNAVESAMKGILPIVDDFERGLEATKSTDDAEAIREGMELIYNKFIKYLGQNGVKVIESTGAEFDTEYHEAIAMVPTGDDAQKGKVIDTVTKGYTINDKVLRHAKVAVGQ